MYALHTHVTTYRHMHAQAYPTDTCIVTRITHRHMHPTATSRANTCKERTNMRTRMPRCGCMRNTHTHTSRSACIQTRMHTHAHTHTHSLTLPHTCLHLLRARHAYLPAYVGCMHFRSRTRMPSHEMFVHMHVRTGARTHLCAHVNVRKG